jgi:hypothetical protein
MKKRKVFYIISLLIRILNEIYIEKSYYFHIIIEFLMKYLGDNAENLDLFKNISIIKK